MVSGLRRCVQVQRVPARLSAQTLTLRSVLGASERSCCARAALLYAQPPRRLAARRRHAAARAASRRCSPRALHAHAAAMTPTRLYDLLLVSKCAGLPQKSLRSMRLHGRRASMTSRFSFTATRSSKVKSARSVRAKNSAASSAGSAAPCHQRRGGGRAAPPPAALGGAIRRGTRHAATRRRNALH
jgi:hypothetical protein